MGPDGPEDADFATTLDADPLCFHRRPEETAAMFEERVCEEPRVGDERDRCALGLSESRLRRLFRMATPTLIAGA
jgi:hypothetical protein